MLNTLCLILITCLIFFAFFVLKKKNVKINYKKVLLGLEIAVFALSFFKCVMNDDFIHVINGGEIYGVVCNKTDILETIVRWVVLTTEVLTITLLVTNHKHVKTILFYVCLPLMILSSLYFDKSLSYYLTNANIGAVILPNFLTYVLLYSEMIILMIIPLMIKFLDCEDINPSNKNEWISMIKLGVFSLFTCVPFLTFPSLFGHTSVEIQVFNLVHIGWILSIIAVYCLFYFFFRKELQEVRRTILSIMVIFLFLHFNMCFKVGITISRLPFQLCNLASYLFVIILFTKNKGLFNFIFLANPVGALIAVATLSETGEIFRYWMIHYLVEHLWVCVIPLLFVALGEFEFPTLKKATKSYLLWFNIYFFSMLLFNCVENGLIVKNFSNNVINDVNFFFLIDCPVKDVLPFYKDLLIGKINLLGQDVYIVYLLFIYVVFSVLCYVLYFGQAGLFKLASIIKKENRKYLFE